VHVELAAAVVQPQLQVGPLLLVHLVFQRRPQALALGLRILGLDPPEQLKQLGRQVAAFSGQQAQTLVLAGERRAVRWEQLGRQALHLARDGLAAPVLVEVAIERLVDFDGALYQTSAEGDESGYAGREADGRDGVHGASGW